MVPGNPVLEMGCKGRQNGPRQGGFTGKLLCYGMSVETEKIFLVCWSAGVLLHFQKDEQRDRRHKQKESSMSL